MAGRFGARLTIAVTGRAGLTAVVAGWCPGHQICDRLKSDDGKIAGAGVAGDRPGKLAIHRRRRLSWWNGNRRSDMEREVAGR